MGILTIEPASLSGMRFLFSFYGLSETGKTLSALRVAAGLEPDPQKRMLLDTEGGQRGRAYVNEIVGGYLYACLSPPYTPERYMQALTEIEAAGVTVLVTDSASHSWFAEGGVLSMVEESTVRNDMAKWKDPKRRLGKMMQRYRSSDMHHILCSRAKQPLIEGKDEQGRKTYVPGPVIPIQEKMMRYDMTVIAHMISRGTFSVAAPAGKCPDNLLPIFSATPLMNEETGRRLAEWVSIRDRVSPEARALRVQAAEVAALGTDAYSDFWRKIGRAGQSVLQAEHDNLKSIAKAADDERARQDADTAAEEQAVRERDDPSLDAPFGEAGIEFASDQDESPRSSVSLDQESGERAGSEKPQPDRLAGLAIEPRLKAGKPDWRAWAVAQFGTKIKQKLTTPDLADFLGANEQNLAHARSSVDASVLRDMEAAIFDQWKAIGTLEKAAQ